MAEEKVSESPSYALWLAGALAVGTIMLIMYIFSEVKEPWWNWPPCWRTDAWKYRRWKWRPWESPHVDNWYKDAHPRAWLHFPWYRRPSVDDNTSGPYGLIPNY